MNKAELRRQNREKQRVITRKNRAIRRQELKCFWTWPFGHVPDTKRLHCTCCPKTWPDTTW